MMCTCCKCKSAIKVNGKWHKVSLEDVLFIEKKPVTSGYCPDCSAGSIDEIQEFHEECLFRDCPFHYDCNIIDMANNCSIYKERRNHAREASKA